MSISEVKKQVGIEGKEKTKVNSIDMETFVQRIEKINNSPIEALKKLINPKLVDLRVDSKKSFKCHNKNKCRVVEVEFKLLFAYNIINYKKGYKYKVNNRDWSLYLEEEYPDSYFGRRAGILFCNVAYAHHTEWHTLQDNMVFRNVVLKTPWALLQPKGYLSTWGSRDWNNSDFDKIFQFRYKNEPTVSNFEKWEKYAKKLKVHNHDSSVKSCSGLSCETGKILKMFSVHPHYLESHYCIGDQDSNNISFKEAQKKRNPFGYMNAVISAIDRVNVGERGTFNVFSDVFESPNLLFDNKLSVYIREMKSILDEFVPSRLIKRLRTVDGHKYTPTCYCFNCLSFRGALYYGMKYDSDKLLTDNSPITTKDDFKAVLDHIENEGSEDTIMEMFCGDAEDSFNRVSYTFMGIMRVLLEMNPLDDKYQVKKSMLDYMHFLLYSIVHDSNNKLP